MNYRDFRWRLFLFNRIQQHLHLELKYSLLSLLNTYWSWHSKPRVQWNC